MDANESCLLHYSYAEDHGCTVDVYEGAKRVCQLRAQFESTRKPKFERDAFVQRSLMTAKAASSVERWLTGKWRTQEDPDAIVGRALGLRKFRWFAYRYELDAAEPDEGRVEVDVNGTVRGSSPQDVVDDEIEELLRAIPPTKKVTAGRPKPALDPEHADALRALADVAATLSSRTSSKKSPPPTRARSKAKR